MTEEFILVTVIPFVTAFHITYVTALKTIIPIIQSSSLRKEIIEEYKIKRKSKYDLY